MKFRLLLVIAVLSVGIGFSTLLAQMEGVRPKKHVLMGQAKEVPAVAGVQTSAIAAIPPVHAITLPYHVFQSYNNCGPATLAMYLNYWGAATTQEELGQIIRPYQVPSGDNDDKSVTFAELAEEAQKRGYVAYTRPGGSIGLIKQLVAAEIPVAVRTWLEAGDDIGHYRLIKGYDDTSGVLLQDDSYQGRDRTYTYAEFDAIWQPFQREYLVIVPPEKKAAVESILGGAVDEHTAWEHALSDAKDAQISQPHSPYPIFNEAIANYHLGNYQQTVQLYEQVADRLPKNILWYQIEPIAAYAKLGNKERVFAMSDAILNGGNRAYSELYMLRGQLYEKEGNIEAARAEYQQAAFYNSNLQAPKDALNRLN